MKQIYLILLFISVSYAEKLEITADKFVAQNSQKMVTFLGNARIKQGSTSMRANKIVVYFADDNSTDRYHATGTVSFSIKKLKANYKGTCNSIIYIPKKKTYKLVGKVQIRDRANSRDISGDHISLNAKTGSFIIRGAKKKQAKLIFDMN